MELAHGLGPTFGMQIHLDVDAMWSCSLFIFFHGTGVGTDAYL